MEPATAHAETLEPTLVIRPSILERLDFLALFGSEGPVEVELGAGDGSFILQRAAEHPERNFLAVERLLGRLRKIDRQGRRRGLENLRGLQLEASYVLGWMIPPLSLDALHVYFPDPWPKRRHWRRRLVNGSFAELAVKALRPGGFIFVRTDHEPYFQQMTQVLGAQPGFRPVDEPDGLLNLVTDFEREFTARGIPTLHAAYQRSSSTILEDALADSNPSVSDQPSPVTSNPP